MSTWPFVKLEPSRLKGNADLGENWIQDRIAEDSEILGLGALSIVRRERFENGLEQLTAARRGSPVVYALLVRNGATDEAQFVRAMESWSKARGNAPGITAVVVSEEIGPRYLTLLAALRHSVPLAAIEMQAMKVGQQMTVIFTPVAGNWGSLEQTGETPQNNTVAPNEDSSAFSAVDRRYWERNSPSSVEMADRLLAITQAIDPAIELTYRRDHIGLAPAGELTQEFARFTPEPSGLLLGLDLRQNSLIELSIAQAGLERLPNQGTHGGYQIHLASAELAEQSAPVARLIQLAYEESRA